MAYQILHGGSFNCQSHARKHTGKEKCERKEVLHLGRQHREVTTTLSAPLPPQRNSIKPEYKALDKRREDLSKHDYAGFGADVIESSPQTHVCSPPEAPDTEEGMETKIQRPQTEAVVLTVIIIGPEPQKTEIAKARGWERGRVGNGSGRWNSRRPVHPTKAVAQTKMVMRLTRLPSISTSLTVSKKEPWRWPTAGDPTTE